MSTNVKKKRELRAAERRRLRQARTRLWIAGIAVLVFVGVVVGLTLTKQKGPVSPAALPKGVEKTQQGVVRLEQPFPDFSVTEVGGRTLTRDSLGGPAIVWFTTSYCVPCQLGAKEVAKLDDELGGRAFDVLVVFVDREETPADLKNWRREFANPDWMVAFDTDLSQKVGLRSLDSKYLLDRNGVVLNMDFAMVGQKYLDVLRKAVVKTS
ncbi:MAG: TlpA family protein disulfide reductase [Candidatus Methylomirabilales bacterium]